MGTKASLIKGSSNYNNILDCLFLIADDIKISDKKRILIKPCLTHGRNLVSTTNANAVKAILDFLSSKTKAEIVIAEGVEVGDTFEVFEKFGYISLAQKYKVKLIDLNLDNHVIVRGLDRNLNEKKFRVSRTVVESDYRISISPIKTHDTYIMYGPLANIAAGSLLRDETPESVKFMEKLLQIIPPIISQSPISQEIKSFTSRFIPNNDKVAINQGYQAINFNIFKLARATYPHLSIVDCFVGMEGYGPIDGSPVPLKCAAASSDFLAAEALIAKIIGIEFSDIGYLTYCKNKDMGNFDMTKIDVVGNSIDECGFKFKRHPYYKNQLNWKNLQLEKFF